MELNGGWKPGFYLKIFDCINYLNDYSFYLKFKLILLKNFDQ